MMRKCAIRKLKKMPVDFTGVGGGFLRIRILYKQLI